jgi:chemosensory pili system protein ChpA (sensor histidine kinase/response regulator)
MLVTLTLQPIRWRLDRAKQHVQRVARSLGKTAPDVHIEEDGLRLGAEDLSAFWSASVHLLNNVADHGIESDAERRARGKPVPALLRMTTRLDRTELIFELSDDGPGIDWERLAARCGLTGGAPSDAAARERLLFTAGVSQRDHASEVSGRGAGLGAFFAAIVGLKGRVEVSSVFGAGTAFRVRVPLDGMQYGRIPRSELDEQIGIVPNVT